jgi:hypothetical protein
VRLVVSCDADGLGAVPMFSCRTRLLGDIKCQKTRKSLGSCFLVGTLIGRILDEMRFRSRMAERDGSTAEV